MRQKHYQKRARQRGISEPLIQLIISYGRRSRRPGGAEAVRLGGKGVDAATKDIKKVLQEVPKLRDVVVVTRNDEIVTVYHRSKKRLKFH